MVNAKFLMVEQSSFRNCNLQCIYCSPKGEKQFPKSISLEALRAQEILINQWLKDNVSPAIFKISGNGEITLLPDFHQFLFPAAQNVLITNGTQLTPANISFLAQFKKNLVIQYSLDGWSEFANSLRIKSHSMQDHILNNLETIVNNEIPVEINCVLTSRNIPYLKELMDYLVNLTDFYPKSNLLAFLPFPIRSFRHADVSSLYPTVQNIAPLTHLFLDKYSQYEKILPPFEYLKDLLRFIQQKSRPNNRPCYIKNFSLFIGSMGEVLWCGCGGTRKYGSLYNGGLERRLQQPYQGLEPCCSICFTHYEVVNLYIADLISLPEISRIPSYASLKVQEYLKTLVMELGGKTN